MEDKITIIEGPPHTFQSIEDGWALGLNDSPHQFRMSLTHLRTFNGPALVERCHRAWNQKGVIYLHYRNTLGLEERAPIFAARSLETEQGQVLVLWVRHEGEPAQPRSSGEQSEDSDNEV